MATDREIALKVPANPCDVMIKAIDMDLLSLHEVLKRAFAGGSDKPQGDMAVKEQVFSDIWAGLSAANDIHFDTAEDLTKYFTNYQQYLEFHIQNSCVNQRADRQIISANKVKLLASLVQVYYAVMKYRFFLEKLSDIPPEDYLIKITQLLQTCERVENELNAVDFEEINDATNALSLFTIIVLHELSLKGYTKMAVAEKNDKEKIAIPALISLKYALKMLPAFEELHKETKKYAEVEVDDETEAKRKRILKTAIIHLARAKARLSTS